LELETARRQKAEQEVASMKEERKKMEYSIATLLEEKENLECHVAGLNEENKMLETSVATVKEEKRKVEFYVADLLKLTHDHRAKMKKIDELCEENGHSFDSKCRSKLDILLTASVEANCT
jgi:uncharacterized protein (DUF3084 family)